MTKNIFARMGAIAVATGITVSLTGCATTIKTDDLKRPDTISCIDVPEGVESRTTYGLFNVRWITKLVAGPYISEREDANGTYYRGPYEAISVATEGSDRPATTFDGGIWVPRNGDQPPVLYRYFATKDPASSPPKGGTCADAMAIGATDAVGVNRVTFSASGIAKTAADEGFNAGLSAGTAGAFTGGQVTGAGVAGGAVGGLIVAALIQMDVGKITHAGDLSDDNLTDTLMQLAQGAKPIKVAPVKSTD